MPWKVDGRTWHLKDRLTADGKPCRWEGEILAHLESLCAAIKGLAPLDWNERQVVEITAPGKPDSWFCHAMTGMEWLVKLVFRVGRGTFDASELETKLGITPLNKTEGLQIYGNEPRVRVAAMKTQPWQSVTLLVHRMSEVNTPAFRSFLEQAAKSYLAQLDKLREKPEVLMPWKLMGEAWHTNAKGFPIGAPRQWDASLLPAIMTLLREAVPSLDFEFDSRDTITGRIPGRRRIWLTLKTKDPSGLECRLAGAKGGLNLGHLSGLGSEREISSDREVDDICRLVFQRPSDLDAPLFRALLVRHAASAVDKASV
jgi:excinuclease ABC subunit A